MLVAPDVRSLKRRLDRFVWENKSTEAVALRGLLLQHFDRFESLGIIGGLVRDLARGGRAEFKSDLDLVIEANQELVAQLAREVGARQNRFGGYGFKVGPWKVDFWALENTWAVAQGHVAASGLRDVIRCTFFDSDAVVYDLRQRRILCDDSYLERLRFRRLEILLRSNPGDRGNLLRAARRILKWEAQPGPQLSLFIDQQLNADSFDAIRAAERIRHPDCVLLDFRTVGELRSRLLSEPTTKKLDRQMKLPL